MREEIRYLSNNGTDTVYAGMWHALTPKPLGIVQIVHDLGERAGDYEDLAHYLASAGFIVCGHDQLGHGRSVGKNGPGYFAPAGGWSFMVEDVGKLAELMKKRFPELPYFVLGHGMGSFIVRMFATSGREGIDGVLISGTAGRAPLIASALVVAKVIRRLKGAFYRGEELAGIAAAIFGRTKKSAHAPLAKQEQPETEYEPEVVFPDTEFVPEADAEDSPGNTRDADSAEEKTGGWDAVFESEFAERSKNACMTAGGYIDLFKMLEIVSSVDWAIGVPKHLPVIVFSGDADPVGDFGKGVKQVYNRLRAAGVADVEIKLYENVGHNLYGDFAAREVYEDIAKWIFNRL